jgi:uncharacterized membrane protein YcaP (DUF421 family)
MLLYLACASNRFRHGLFRHGGRPELTPVTARSVFPNGSLLMDQIIPFDPDRMIWGTEPALFYLEIVVRVVVIWLWTVLLLRWVGGRSVSQMSVVEFLLVIALGSAVGDPMFHPDIPLLHAMLVILLVVLADKAVDYVLQHWSKAKRIVDGKPTEILRDGHLCQAGLQAERVGAHEVMEQLRLKGIRNLGQVELAFMEPSGDLSIFKYDKPRRGLPIVPPLELRALDADGEVVKPCCVSCGLLRKSGDPTCPECKETRVAEAEIAETGADPAS